jgi:Fe-S-cluster-containing dehydrogenase component
MVRAFWQERLGGANFEAAWRRAVHDGVMAEGVAGGAQSAKPQAAFGTEAQGAATRPTSEGVLELSLKPDPTLFDGRYANNAWLQECPKPLTTLVWGNAAMMSRETALDIDKKLQNGDVVELEYRGHKVEAPVWIMPGHAPGCVTLHLGHGHPNGTAVGKDVGVNAYLLRTSDAPWGGPGLAVRKTDKKLKLAHTQTNHLLDRDYMDEPAREGGFKGLDQRRGHEIIGEEFTFEQFTAAAAAHAGDHGHGHADHGGKASPGTAEGEEHGVKLPVLPHRPKDSDSLYEKNKPADYNDNYKWGMVIDLTSCIGCNACVVGCQSENNVPTVGPEQVQRGREMHWLRIDRYYTGHEVDEPEFVNQPMLCQQCENAPCEVVCPVNATVHSAEGLNDMVYNRCVGTRYCSNNCPYKVRRFNWLEYPSIDKNEPTLHLRSNPNVTIRNRGVMEKCTYCVQRISAGRIEAKKILADFPGAETGKQAELQAAADAMINGIQTACQAACPTQAIVFGNLNDKTTLVAQLTDAQPHNFTVLGELNTRTRTTYLARVRNRNPEIKQDEVHA